MTELNAARQLLEKLQRSAFISLAADAPLPEPPKAGLEMAEYLGTNPEYDSEATQMYEREWQDKPRGPLLERPDLSPLSGSLSILAHRVDNLKGACERLEPTVDLSRICFGTIPGGGLDAYTFKVPGQDEYGIVVPEGFFYLANLVTKVVVLLQPLHGASYLPSAAFEQMSLSAHPYVRFRVVDFLRAYGQNGEPTAALPYLYAIPYQDHFAYLLAGAELYLLAHEAGHVVLGHLTDNGPVLTPEQELEADAFALRVVTSYFAEVDEFSEARASLCGLLFNGLLRMWENMIRNAYGRDVDVFGGHPPAEERFRRFQSLLEEMSGPMPPWYGLVFTGVSFATTNLPDELLPEVVTNAMASGGLNARVLPAGSSLTARYSTSGSADQWWRTIAGLVLSHDRYQRRLGLWFLLQQWPESANALYRGLLDDDTEWAATCQAALVSIEPIYESYLPRLRERFHTVDEQDAFDGYIESISDYLLFATLGELNPINRTTDPMSAEFVAGLHETFDGADPVD